jgi:hypothetical protein
VKFGGHEETLQVELLCDYPPHPVPFDFINPVAAHRSGVKAIVL